MTRPNEYEIRIFYTKLVFFKEKHRKNMMFFIIVCFCTKIKHKTCCIWSSFKSRDIKKVCKYKTFNIKKFTIFTDIENNVTDTSTRMS